VIMLSFHYFNPRFGEVGAERTVSQPLPDCLGRMLKKKILKNAKRDDLAKVKARVQKEPDVKAVLRAAGARLKREFEPKCGTNSGRVSTRTPSMTMETFVHELFERGVMKDVTVHPTPAVTGTVPPPVHSNLSALDIKGAFVTGQTGEQHTEYIDFGEFQVMLALCGHIKYEEVEEMSLAQRVAGIVANFLGEKDEQMVITEAVVPRAPRFDPSSASPNEGSEPQQHQAWLATWRKMDLAHVFGFPLWEKEVFMLLQRDYSELLSIFTYYGKSGSAGSSSATAASTLQQTELINLALDCGLTSEAFPMVRVQDIFTRADQEDDKTSAGNRALAFHEFLEAMVMLAFHRANPRFGTLGHERDASHLLPECLESLLDKQLLKKAKQDTLARCKRAITTDKECAAIFKAYTPAIRKEFELLSKQGQSCRGNCPSRPHAIMLAL
jgi:hypothetical protein